MQRTARRNTGDRDYVGRISANMRSVNTPGRGKAWWSGGAIVSQTFLRRSLDGKGVGTAAKSIARFPAPAAIDAPPVAESPPEGVNLATAEKYVRPSRDEE
jgi:hypothetical protein